MRIVVTYDKSDESIWQHFGRTEFFKVYEVENGQVVSSEIVDTNGIGHGALIGIIDGLAADVFICGGCGSHIAETILSHGISMVPGVQGNADEAVAKFLAGELTANEGAVHEGCHHHDEVSEEESCGCGGSCGGGCGSGGGCGGCHNSGPLFEGPNAGKLMRVHYIGTLNDGSVFDSSYDRGEPLEFVCAMGMMISGFDKAVVDMKVGEIKEIHLMPEEAYGPIVPEAIITVPISSIPGAEDVSVGQIVYLSDPYGRPIPVAVTAKDDVNVTFDANHEMAGKELNFKIEVVEIVEE